MCRKFQLGFNLGMLRPASRRWPEAGVLRGSAGAVVYLAQLVLKLLSWI